MLSLKFNYLESHILLQCRVTLSAWDEFTVPVFFF